MAKKTAKQKKAEEEERFKRLKEILYKRLEEMKIVDVIEYGGLTVLGIMIYDALGRIPASYLEYASVDSEKIVQQKMKFNARREMREALIDFTELLNLDFNFLNVIAGVGPTIKPFAVLGNPVKELIDVKRDMDFPGMYGLGYIAVPEPYRVMLSLALPSVLFLIIEFVKGTVEVG